jgi:hypothetical protein
MLIFYWVRYDIIIDTELKPWLIEVCAYHHHKYNKAYCYFVVTLTLCAYVLGQCVPFIGLHHVQRPCHEILSG